MVILTTFPPPTEGVRHRQDHTEVFINRKSLGKGTTYIAESRLSWMSETGQGFSIEYPAVSLHAISRDPSAFRHECLYLQVEGDLDEDENLSSSTSEEGDPPPPMTEVRFCPSDIGVLDAMFNAMSDCQALHPDEEADFSGEEEEYYEEAGGGDNLTQRGQAVLNRLDDMLVVPEEEADEPRIGAQAANGGHHSGTNMDSEPMDTGQFDDVDVDH